jgi:8-oxo-dGTP pyrophosphatase MutT (NUDIX family)
MVRRHDAAPFMGGAHVFPGGSVDPGDRDLASPAWCDGTVEAQRQLPGLDPGDAVAFHVAAIRELFEEAGVLLARDGQGRFVSLADGSARSLRLGEVRRELYAGERTLREILEAEELRLAADALSPFAHWVTPPTGGRRFDTRFFVARLPPGQAARHDAAENTAGAWFTAGAALAAAQLGRIVLPPPTWTTLRHLERFGSIADVVDWCRSHEIPRREPLLIDQDGTRVLLMPGDPLNPEEGVEFVPPETRFAWREGQWRPEPAAFPVTGQTRGRSR